MAKKKIVYQTSLETPADLTTKNPTDIDKPVEWFRGDFDFLSNFYPHPVEVDGITYPTSEHAFQAMKVHENEFRYKIQTAATPAAAKALGQKVPLREDWDDARFAEMERILRAKFADPTLRQKLLDTGNRELIEGNTWRDTTWGCVKDDAGNWKGRNELGKLLMRLREELRAEAGNATPEPGEVSMTDSDQELVQAALQARQNAYAPYSHYAVGAAVRTINGTIFAGCNIENASYGLCICAERTAVFAAVAAGQKEIVEVAVVTEDGGTPCGACRQVLMEFVPVADRRMRILLCEGTGTIVRETTLEELFPLAFTLKR